MSISPRYFATALAFIALSATGALIAEESTQAATDRYFEYLAFVPQAETLDGLAPYYAEWWSKLQMRRSEEEKQATLEREQESVAEKAGIEVVEASGSEGEVEIRLSAKWKDMPMQGKVSMVHEAGSWRIKEQFWATGRAD